MKKTILIVVVLLVMSNIIHAKKKGEEPNTEHLLIINQEKINSIENWGLIFKYESKTVEIKEDKNGNSETTTKYYGYSDVELQFLDDLFYILKYKNNIDISKYADNTDLDVDGYIKINIIYPGGVERYFSVEISFYDSNNILLAKNRFIEYSNGSLYFKVLEKEVITCSKFILSLLK